MKIKFEGSFRMKKLTKVMFIYDDGTADSIEDPRAAMLFQSRCNNIGWLSHKISKRNSIPNLGK